MSFWEQGNKFIIIFHISTQATVYFKSIFILFSSARLVLPRLLLGSWFILKSVFSQTHLGAFSPPHAVVVLMEHLFKIDLFPIIGPASPQLDSKIRCWFPSGDVKPTWLVPSAGWRDTNRLKCRIKATAASWKTLFLLVIFFNELLVTPAEWELLVYYLWRPFIDLFGCLLTWRGEVELYTNRISTILFICRIPERYFLLVLMNLPAW